MDAIYFDMDGTIANLYGYDGWLEKLHNADTSPYEEAEPLINMEHFNAICAAFEALGITLGVISWAAKESEHDYKVRTKAAKKEWIKKHCPALANEFHVLGYGQPKHRAAKVKNAVLVDDNKEVRAKWKGYTIDATNPRDMFNELENLLNSLMGTIDNQQAA